LPSASNLGALSPPFGWRLNDAGIWPTHFRS